MDLCHHKEDEGTGAEGGVRCEEEKGKQYKVRYRFLYIDTQAVIAVYAPATSVSGEKWRETGVQTRGLERTAKIHRAGHTNLLREW